MKQCIGLSILFMIVTLEASAYMVLHTEISLGLEEMQNARDSLPSTIVDNQCVVACYNKVMISGYCVVNSNYDKDGICHPDDYQGNISVKNSKYNQRCFNLINCHDQQCWAGDHTGGVYHTEGLTTVKS